MGSMDAFLQVLLPIYNLSCNTTTETFFSEDVQSVEKRCSKGLNLSFEVSYAYLAIHLSHNLMPSSCPIQFASSDTPQALQDILS